MDDPDLTTQELESKLTHDDTPRAQVLADFRQAWHEAMTGQGIPITQLWADLDHAVHPTKIAL